MGLRSTARVRIVGAMVVGPGYNAIIGVALGVFISVTTTPAAASAGVAAAYSSWGEAPA